MRKLATLFLMIVSMGLLFAGAVSAEATVDVTVTDENGNPIDEASPDDVVVTEITASANDQTIQNPWILIYTDPETGLEFDLDSAVMIFNGAEYQYDPNDEFIWECANGFDGIETCWCWWIGWAVQNNQIIPGDTAQLFLGGTVIDLGSITVNGDFYNTPPTTGTQTLITSEVTHSNQLHPQLHQYQYDPDHIHQMTVKYPCKPLVHH
ncbi:MAG: hypothetical protein LLF83_00270 [Methanobacterium sp.]|nr:hypothetical protein [Methanobacterium sp.]